MWPLLTPRNSPVAALSRVVRKGGVGGIAAHSRGRNSYPSIPAKAPVGQIDHHSACVELRRGAEFDIKVMCVSGLVGILVCM
jgi:hypothetical protein